MTRYAEIEDYEQIAEFDHHVPSKVLKQAIAQRRVMVFKSAEIVMGIVRFSYFWDSIPFLNLLYVPDGYTHSGVGSKLLEFWEGEMKAQGYARVLISTMAKERGQHFFRKFGYCDIGNLYDEGSGLELILEKRL